MEVGSFPLDEDSDHVAAGNYAYAFLSWEFVVLDVSDPAAPVEVGSCPAQFYGNLTVTDNVVYSVSGDNGLEVFDIADPTQPAAIGSLDLPVGASETAVSGDLLFVANGRDGLTVVDVQEPSQPEVTGSCDLPGFARGVACRWPFAYIAASGMIDDPGGIYVLDISEPTAPELVAGQEIPGDPDCVAVDGSLVYVAVRWRGIMAFRHEAGSGAIEPQEHAATRLSNYPNPFNPSATIRFEVAAASQVTVAMYDLAGRHVRTLVDAPVAAGEHTVSWDGTDDAGAPVEAGAYFYRLTVGGEAVSRRMLLVR